MEAYVIITKSRTRSQADLDRYAKQFPAFMGDHKATFLTKIGTCDVVEGPGVEGVAILRFDSIDEARAWYHSPTYQEASKDRWLGGDYQIVIVEGVS